jgi:hypothetical protein
MINGQEKLAKDWKDMAAAIFSQHPHWNAAQIRRQLIVILGSEAKAPGISAVQKYRSDVLEPNNRVIQDSGLDNSWHLGTLEDYTITSEALPFIFLVQEWLEKYPDAFNNPPPQEPLTIRQAIWIGRLYTTIDKSKLKAKKYLTSIAKYLFSWAQAYAMREIVCNTAGTPFDTTSLDRPYRESAGYPITAGKTTLIHYPDRSFYIDTIDENLLQQMEQMKKEGEK